MIHARALEKSYAKSGHAIAVLRGIDIDVERGDFIAITGASGSGKSTLLHILGALDSPSAGRYAFCGREVADIDDDARSRLRAASFGFVFQSFHLLPQLTILENVALPFLYSGSPGPDATARAQRALERVGLAHRLEHTPAELSGGEMQRAAIARAIVVEPEVVFADEPTGNLDSGTGAQVLDLLGELNRAGTTLVLVTHDAAVASRAHRRMHLTDGRFDA
jgi:putative ABC transport system ATP-binding protein